MKNDFLIDFINEGKIKDESDLKKVFREYAKKFHPDTAMTDKYVNDFVRLKEQYEEALTYLHENEIHVHADDRSVTDSRYSFFIELLKIYHLDSSFSIKEKKRLNQENIYENAYYFFIKWKPEISVLFKNAMIDYEGIKKKKYENAISNLRKPTLFLNLRPFFFNIASYHLTGKEIYKKRLNQNLEPIIKRLEESGFNSFRDLLLFLIRDTENGSAVFG